MWTAAGSTLVASWASGRELLGLNTAHAGYVIGLNMVVPSSDNRNDFGWRANTDGGRLVANSLLMLPEPGSLLILAAGAGGLLRRRSSR